MARLDVGGAADERGRRSKELSRSESKPRSGTLRAHKGAARGFTEERIVETSFAEFAIGSWK